MPAYTPEDCCVIVRDDTRTKWQAMYSKLRQADNGDTKMILECFKLHEFRHGAIHDFYRFCSVAFWRLYTSSTHELVIMERESMEKYRTFSSPESHIILTSQTERKDTSHHCRNEEPPLFRQICAEQGVDICFGASSMAPVRDVAFVFSVGCSPRGGDGVIFHRKLASECSPGGSFSVFGFVSNFKTVWNR